MKNTFLLLSILLLTAFCFFNAKAQPGVIDPTFNPTDVGFGFGDGANDVVNSNAIQSDGKIIIGGAFFKYNGTTVDHLARLNTDGRLDSSFSLGIGANGDVKTIAIQNDGKIIIGGDFITYNGTIVNHIARINSDRSLDTTFHVGSGVNGSLKAIAIQSDGKIIIGGSFTSYNGISTNNIARINTDGSLDSNFSIGTGPNGQVKEIDFQNDGKIIMQGSFTSYNGVGINYIARINSDGSLDSSFNLGLGTYQTVRMVAIQNDGKIIIVGDFTSVNGTNIKYIARVNTNGSLDTTFNSGTGPESSVYNCTIQSDGKIIIYGSYSSYNGTAVSRLIRLNSNGSLDTTFYAGPITSINSISMLSNGKIFISGSFSSYNGIAVNRIARINSDGSYDFTFNKNTGASNTIFASAIQSDGKIVIGGSFHFFNGKFVRNLARLNIDGSLDTTFNSGIIGVNGFVNTISIQSDGKIIIGGNFTSYDGFQSKNIARINTNGTFDSTFYTGSGFNSYVNCSTILSNGKIIIGGFFSTFNGTAIKSIVRLNVDGSLDNTFNSGSSTIYDEVLSFAIQSDGKIIVGGNIYGLAAANIGRLNIDGVEDTTFIAGSGTNSQINTISLQGDGKIIIGGEFSDFNGVNKNRIARLNTDGSLDVNFSAWAGWYVNKIVIQNDGRILVGGEFNSMNGISQNNISCLNSNGSLDLNFNSGTGANDHIHSLVIQNDGRLIIGGDFTAYNEIGRNRIARIMCNCITTSSVSETACVSYTAPDGQIYTTSGIKTAIIQSAQGCDSIITINLTINPVDISMTINDSVITANASGATYKWVDCNNNYLPVPGAINQSFTATVNGNYAVIVTQGLCSDTSACVQINLTGIRSEQTKSAISIYPNPVSNELFIEMANNKETVTFQILNSMGQIVFKGTFAEKTVVQTSSFAKGLYLIKLENNKIFEFRKFVKE